MAAYDYICRDCRAERVIHVPIETADTDPTKRLYDAGHMVHECGGVFRRNFRTVKISGYRNEWFDPQTGQTKTLTSERELIRELRRQSDAATEYTGIVHDFQPVDLNDPSVVPDTDAGKKSQHDAAVKSGKVESKGRFVHDLSGPGK